MTPSSLPELTIRSFTARAVLVPMSVPLHTSTGAITQVPLVLVDCDTQQGVRGHAYLFAILPAALKPMVSLVESMSQMLTGDPLAPLCIERKLAQRFTLLGLAGVQRLAQAAIDMAAWDALARARGLPLAQLLGGEARPVRAYNSKGLGIMPLSQLQDEAKALLVDGFSALKVRVGRPDAADDLKAIRAVREAVGDTVSLMCDFNQALTVNEAIRRGRLLDDEGLVWIEEPVRHDDYAGCARVAAQVSTSIQIGENFGSSHAMLEALTSGACDLVMPDIQRIGGVTGWLRAAALAQAHGIEMSTHLFPEISAHVMTATPTAHWLEYVDWANPVLKEPLQVRNGFVQTTQTPGSGVEWDEAAVARYRVG